MKHSICSRLLPLLLAFVLLLTGCGGEGDSSVEKIDVEQHTPDTILVDTEDGHYAAIYLPSDSFSVIKEYDNMGALYYVRYGGWRSDIYYMTSSVSELQMDIAIYLCDEDMTGEELVEETAAAYESRDSYLDLGKVQYGDWVYRQISFTATATDGTDYKARIFLTTDGVYLTIFQIVEYVGSEDYISYSSMKDICGQVMASLTFTK